MHITRLTPEQACALGEHLARIGDFFRQLVDALTEVARRLTEAFRPVVEYLRRCGLVDEPSDRSGRRPRATRGITADRPAWASPYGPAPRRRR